MLGPLPGHPQPTQGQSNGVVADQPRREALGETDLGGERERPPARRLALGTGEEDLAAAYSKGGRRPETGLKRSPLVRRERAHK